MQIRAIRGNISSPRNLCALGDLCGSIERITGEDVTDAVVEVEARLQSERRIEKELLELLDKRPDAPLKELLEVRNELSRVRLMIEQLAGQREHLGRLVSLATVLVLVRVPDAIDKPIAEPTMLDYVAQAFNSAARSGMSKSRYWRTPFSNDLSLDPARDIRPKASQVVSRG